MINNEQYKRDTRRLTGILLLVGVVISLLTSRAIDLHVFSKDFLQNQGDARYLREISEPATRGMIMDRNGEPLAISTPVDSVWANPRELQKNPELWSQLSVELGIDTQELKTRLNEHSGKEFMYLKRQVIPEVARRVTALAVPGVFLTREYRRYYPAGEVTAHVVGFTDIDDHGQEGIELAYDKWLRGVDGVVRVIKDRIGQTVEEVAQVKLPRAGEDIILTLDKRLQYLAYRELLAATQEHHADAGSAVILDARSGEVLAMVNQPAYNPNDRDQLQSDHLRNRAVTDVFEPGSVVKPFTVAAALESGLFEPQTVIDTSPGRFRVGNKTIRDIHNYGLIDVSTIIKKSSNVGASIVALSIEPRKLWGIFAGAGFGITTGVDFPGESTGLLTDYYSWRNIERASLSFGYGLSVTALQLARAYTIFSDSGALKPVSLVRKNPDPYDPAEYYKSAPVLKMSTAKQVREMMETVVTDGGTAVSAKVHGYKIAGKTGTVKKTSADGGYAADSYISLFVGMAPASDPRLIMVVMINEPHGEVYYGGAVAAPVFSKVMAGALRMLDIAPDDLPSMPVAKLAMYGGGK